MGGAAGPAPQRTDAGDQFIGFEWLGEIIIDAAFEAFDPRKGAWEVLPPLPTARSNLAAAVMWGPPVLAPGAVEDRVV